MTAVEHRLLRELPTRGVCSLRRAGYQAGLSDTAAGWAARALKRLGFLTIKEKTAGTVLLELTSTGRTMKVDLQAEVSP